MGKYDYLCWNWPVVVIHSAANKIKTKSNSFCRLTGGNALNKWLAGWMDG